MTLPGNWTDGATFFHASDQNAVENQLNTNTAALMLQPITVYADNTSPLINQTSYYNATGGNRTPALPALSGLTAGQRLAVRRDPADTSTNTVTLSCAGSDSFYSSGATSTTFPLSGEQRAFQVVSVAGTKYWAPAGSLNPISSLDGRYPLKSGGTLDGCTIGATTSAVSIKATTLTAPATAALTASKPWINQSTTLSGSPGVPMFFNNISLNDQVDAGFNWVYGLRLLHNVQSPAVGLRAGIYSKLLLSGAGTQTYNEAQYVGITGQVQGNTSFGGTSGSGNAIGEIWASWFFGQVTAGTYLDFLAGSEIAAAVASGATVASKIGLLVNTAIPDAVRGYNLDAAICVATATGTSTTWQNGILFGRNQAPGTVNWPFDNTSTMIGVVQPGNANIGIDFTGVTFTGPAIKVPAPIAMTTMSSAPSAISGAGMLYVASDLSLHYLTTTADMRVAPANYTGVSPADYGWIAWNYDVTRTTGGTTAITAGQANLSLLPIRQPATITNVIVDVGTAGASLTSGQCFAGLFDHSGNLLSASADQATNWQTTGLKTIALTAPQSVAAGMYYVGFFANGTTLPKFKYDASATGLGISAGQFLTSPRVVTDTTNTGLTTAFHTPATLTASTTPFWVGVS